MEFAVIAYAAGVVTGGVGLYWALPWIMARRQPLTDRAVSAGAPLRVIAASTSPVVQLRKVG